MKVNNKLPAEVVAKTSNAQVKKEDTTKQFSDMLEIFRDSLRKDDGAQEPKENPQLLNQAPPLPEQQKIIIESLKEQREELEKVNLDLRQKQVLTQRRNLDPEITQDSLNRIANDIKHQDQLKTILDLDEHQFL